MKRVRVALEFEVADDADRFHEWDWSALIKEDVLLVEVYTLKWELDGRAMK